MKTKKKKRRIVVTVWRGLVDGVKINGKEVEYEVNDLDMKGRL